MRTVLQRNFINMAKIKQILNSIDSSIEYNGLVIFDIDDVLITPINNHSFWHPSKEQLLEKIKRQTSDPPNTFIDSISISTTQYRLVDPEIINIFSYLKEKGILTVALTAMGAGEFGVINSLEDLRIETLKNMGIDFTKLNTISNEQISTDETKLMRGKSNSFYIGAPTVKNGIIFTAGVDKAIVLKHVLNKKNYYPQQIIFIDDNLSNIQSLQQLCQNLNIDFYGFHYVAVSVNKHLPPVMKNELTCKLF